MLRIVKYDLERRTEKFAEDVLVCCRSVQTDHIAKPMILQLVRSATSVGANYAEANGASSKKDFKNKIYIAKKETRESKYWLGLLIKYFPAHQAELGVLRQESHELILIFQKITNTLSEDT